MSIILDLIIIGIISLSTWLGYKKGLTKSFLKIFTFLIASIISLILFKPIGNIVINQTSIVDNLQSTISNSFIKQDSENKNEDKNNDTDKNKKIQEENANIFYQYIEDKVTESKNELKDTVIKRVTREIAISIVNIGIYIVLFITLRIILIFVKAIADLITKLPVIKQFDELGGGVYGFARASIIILIMLTIISIILTFIPSPSILNIINETILIRFLYENIVLQLFL